MQNPRNGRPGFLTRRGLLYYWRSNLAVGLGVATAVTVLAGALLVGDSVRGSLRDLVLQRIGRTTFAIVSSDFFDEGFAQRLRSNSGFPQSLSETCPVIIVPGAATNQSTGSRALGVQVYGVDDRFWRFHGRTPRAPGAGGPREVLLSAALARDIGAEAGATILLRIQKPSDIPLDSLHGRKDDVGTTIRLTSGGVLDAGDLGDFSLQAQQGEVRAAFVPLSRLQQDLDFPARVNAVLLSAKDQASDGLNPDDEAALQALIRNVTTPDDVGLRVRPVANGALSVESKGTLITAAKATAIDAAAASLGLRTAPVFTYLVNRMTVGEYAIPYSLVTALDLATIWPPASSSKSGEAGDQPIVLNTWAAQDLRARPGDTLNLEYFAWEDPGVLQTRSASFKVAAVVPILGAAADRDLVPFYPGVSDSDNLSDWDPPFPIDLRQVRPQDEDYWRTYRTTPKAFIPLAAGQALWQSRHGSSTSIRVVSPAGSPDADAFSAALRSSIDPMAAGLALRNVRQDGLGASRGATDFGEYFTYFSFFLVVSALLLAVLFFKLGIEQRAREIGLLRAVGFTPAAVRKLFIIEGLALSVAGALLGAAGAVGYAGLMMLGLRSWWVDSVGTTALTLHVSVTSLVVGVGAGVTGAVISILWTLRSLRRVTERSLLAGRIADDLHAVTPPTRRAALSAAGLALAGLLLIAAGAAQFVNAAGAFFGAGGALLAASLAGLSLYLRRPAAAPSHQRPWPLVRLGVRNASYRPWRSVLSVSVVAAAAFVIISVGAFRREATSASSDKRSGAGGYTLMVNTELPLVVDPGSAEGKEAIGISGRPDVRATAFRVRPGDDASCLNLYEPREPRIVGVGPAFTSEGRFSFGGSLAATEAARTNPWLLLETPLQDDAVPAIADANSMTYVLHKSLGDDIVINTASGPVRLRLVAALSDSLLQGELLISDRDFLKLFPDRAGYQLLLVDAPVADVPQVSTAIEDRLSDYGADATSTAERLAEFHRVENTYLSTFQTLGGLGLLLGTVGLAAVLLRNVLERRRELALLCAVGYRRTDILTIILSENAFLLVAGLAIGGASALVAVAPAALERGGRIPAGAGAGLLLFAVLAVGLLSSLLATRVTLRARLLDALKAE